ncbi:MAG: intradiol ring-cleavage dioxygenase [Burkholderiales bacterium]|nr:intradiol ring-cleavage dioxygenase [Burkholderiales bacterium]
MNPNRRTFVVTAWAAGLAASVPCPALASSRRALRQMTDGPFYPPVRWRAQWSDWDADLTRVTQGSETLVARGEHLGLALAVLDTDGRLVDGAEVEIWQCDSLQHYRHPDVAREAADRSVRFDPGFQGFGAAKSDARGELSFRTLKPVPYPGRTPHIHVKLRHASFGEWTSQLFIAGDAGNARDFLWRNVPVADRAALEMKLARAPAASAGATPALAWMTRHELVVPA